MVGSKGHVNDKKCPVNGSFDTLRMVDHVVKGHGYGGHLSGHHVGSRVSNQDHVNACLVDQPRKRVIVGRQHCDFLTGTFHFLKRVSGHFAGCTVHRHEHSTSGGVFKASPALFSLIKEVLYVGVEFVHRFPDAVAGEELLTVFEVVEAQSSDVVNGGSLV